jgi:hypothetical protein
MSNKQQTALEWLYQELFPNKLDGFSFGEWDIIEKAFKEAKELEKQQIINAWVHAETRMPENIKHINNAETYYKETYGE